MTAAIAKKNETEIKITSWRYDRLLEAGYSKLHAKQISERYTGYDAIDLHRAIELVTIKGADPHVAADILI